MLNCSLRKPLDSKIHSDIRNKIISLPKKNHFSQIELARKLSATQSYISKVESGQRRLDIAELNDNFKTLECSILKFFEGIKL